MLAPFSFVLSLQLLASGPLTNHCVDKYKEGAERYKERHLDVVETEVIIRAPRLVWSFCYKRGGACGGWAGAGADDSGTRSFR